MKNKDKEKILIRHNHTLDSFFTKNTDCSKPTLKKGKPKIKVPPSSGLPPTCNPTDVVLRYPLNPQFRQYQQEIVINCVCMNTLVCLPTGLGKTHIAAVLIANFARWFPQQKIIFLAPTRPLVRQQVSALSHLSDQISNQLIVEVSGGIAIHKRQQLYERHKVIFATPQTIQNDLGHGRINGKNIILIIFDECHRAVGNSSYSQIMKHMNKLQVGFRIIGLSATPGGQNEKIQQVVANLNIAKIMYKDDTDPEVKKYLHQKIINQVEIKETQIIKEATTILDELAMPSIGLLIKLQLIQPWVVRKGGLSTTSFFLIREQFMERISKVMQNQKPIAYAALKVLNFLLSCRKALVDQGFLTFKRQFFSEFLEIAQKIANSQKINDEQDSSFAFDQNYNEAVTYLQNLNDESMTTDSMPEDSLALSNSCSLNDDTLKSSATKKPTSSLPPTFLKKAFESVHYKRLHQLFHPGNGKQLPHPKLQKLAEILKTFFKEHQGKAMVFTNFRLTSKQIKSYLQGVEGIKSELFFGQSKTTVEESQNCPSFVLQLKQKEQMALIERYKKGEVNTLISTSIGQEGLDIGEVDCIICYDGGHSPIRSIQRRGRTGRKRTGYVYILLMEGKELNDYRKGVKKEQKMKDLLKKGASKFQFYAYNSSLFDQHSQIPIQRYQNQLKVWQEKITKSKQKKRKSQSDAMPTKKGRGKKKECETTQKDYSNTSVLSESQTDNTAYQFKYVQKLDSILDRYCLINNQKINQNSQTYNIETISEIDKAQQIQQAGQLLKQKQIENHQQIESTIINDEIQQVQEQIRSSFQTKIEKEEEKEEEEKQNEEVEDVVQVVEQSYQQQDTSTPIFDQTNKQELSIIENEQDDEDQDFQIFQHYCNTKQLQTNQADYHNQSKHLERVIQEEEEMSSQQMIEILQRIKNKPNKYYNLDDYQDSY